MDTQQDWKEQTYTKFYETLNDRIAKNIQQYDTAILSLSSGALVLSIAFVRDIVSANVIAAAWALKCSWLALCGSILLTIISFGLSDVVLNASFDRADRELREGEEGALDEKRWFDKALPLTARLAGVMFMSGMCLTCYFAWSNF